MNILVTGGSGLVGNALKNIITKNVTNNIFIFVSSKDANLSIINETIKLFDKYKPDYVIHLAANVGGLFKNLKEKVDMFEKNIMINFNVVKCCHDFNVKKLIACLSTCIFPDKTDYPINENMLHNGPPHKSNEYYAYSKRMLHVQCKSYKEQYNNNFICISPTNIYGPYDNFDLNNSHVIPGLIHQCYLAKKNNKPFVIKGTGKPLRQFIYSEDLAEIILILLKKNEYFDNIIISPKEELSISDIGYLIAKKFNYDNIEFDSNYSDGQYKKTVNNSFLLSIIKDFKFTSIDYGLSKTINHFIFNTDPIIL